MPRRSILRYRTSPGTEVTHVGGPISFLNPTRAKLHKPHPPPSPPHEEKEPHIHRPREDQKPRIEHIWRSRDNRKGRHAIRVHPPLAPPPPKPEVVYILPRRTTAPRAIAKGLLRMVTVFAYWDVSYLVAVIFTLGSVVWCINAFFVWLPLQDPGSTFKNENLTAGGVSAFVGATIFEIGSFFLILEAVNENQTDCFGWALEKAVHGGGPGHPEKETIRIAPSVKDCVHHHADRKTFLRMRHHHHRPSASASASTSPASLENGAPPADEKSTGDRETDRASTRSFTWLPTLTELRKHYIREIGFQASFIQLIGATIFWISGFTGLPGIINHMSRRVTNGVFWVPQMAGGACFIASGLLFAIETQKRWYVPAPRTLGWHIGMWNFVGGIGFTLCGVLGPASGNSGAVYQSNLATFWGSWAFLVGSGIQWYESLQKHPTEVSKEGG
ncbi:uncharacterized protein BDW47DRAFT_114111 [Aspergillus candidus]|uniref:Integral membrane protein n=1 Tax=Aspergillus candidus TaxID=41067 RepID=A0A2I2EYB6_ASPCN|nr:hypothetical protein BDW47DRAFT_114111 [Aspergillus candidus]PLB33371.1 hypothetical protein BDW47DRAFT_114111 [Aspergillus candidus]